MIKKILLLSTIYLLLSTGFVFANHQAGHTNDPDGSHTNTSDTKIVFENPFKTGTNNLYDLARAIVNNVILPIGGVLCVLAFIYSGFMYVIARGDKTKISNAHNALLYSAIGTAVLLGSWVIANVVENTIKALLP